MKKSLLIHTRLGTEERLRNFFFAFNYNRLSGVYALFDEVIIGEFDSEPLTYSIDGFTDYCVPLSIRGRDINWPRPTENGRIYRVFVRDYGEFSRSWTKNFLAKQASGDLLMFADDDFLFQKEGVVDCFDKVLRNDSVLGGAPFSIHRVMDIKLGNPIDFTFPPTSPNTIVRTGLCIGSGALIVKRSAFELVGGFNEDLNGWGLEDNMIEWALWRHGSMVMTKHTAIHLSHEAHYRQQWQRNLGVFQASISLPGWDEKEREKWLLKGLVDEIDGQLFRPMVK
jgi:hypothetical protein